MAKVTVPVFKNETFCKKSCQIQFRRLCLGVYQVYASGQIFKNSIETLSGALPIDKNSKRGAAVSRVCLV